MLSIFHPIALETFRKPHVRDDGTDDAVFEKARNTIDDLLGLVRLSFITMQNELPWSGRLH